jgi:hypothetical protein
MLSSGNCAAIVHKKIFCIKQFTGNTKQGMANHNSNEMPEKTG